MGLPKTWKCHKWIQMASSMGKTWGVTSFTYLFFDHFQTNLAVGRDISPVESVAHCLPVLEGGCGAMHPPHHASAWTLPAQWLSGTHSQSQTTLRWVWFPKTLRWDVIIPGLHQPENVRWYNQPMCVLHFAFYLNNPMGFGKPLLLWGSRPYYFGGPGSTRFRQFI